LSLADPVASVSLSRCRASASFRSFPSSNSSDAAFSASATHERHFCFSAPFAS
jgi:hypothetical protein